MLVEIGVPSLRILNYGGDTTLKNEEEMKIALYFIEEVRDDVALKLKIYQDRVARYYNRKVKFRPLKEGDLVHRNSATTYKGQRLKEAYGKFAAK